MPLAKVRHRARDLHLEVDGGGRIWTHSAGLIATRSVIEGVGMSSLRVALCHYERSVGFLGDVVISVEEPLPIDDDAPVDCTRLVLGGGVLMVKTLVVTEEGEPSEAIVESAIAGLLKRERMRLVETVISRERVGWAVWLTFEVPQRGQSVGEALRRGDAARRLTKAALGGGLDAGSAIDLVRAGHAESLIGEFESEWLEAKSAPYRLDEKSECYELAKDIAAFANASGGLIVIGAKTKRVHRGDRIRTINECVLADISPQRYHGTVKRRIYPKLDGLKVDLVAGSSAERGVAVIEVPRQAEHRKPFLVSGTRDGDRVSELGCTLAMREGAGTVAPRIDILHHLIKTGEGLIRENQALSEVADVRAEVNRLSLQAWEPWLRDVIAATQADGFIVERDRGFIVFRKGGKPSVRVQAAEAPPPADMIQRQQLLERLAALGLEVHKDRKGFLQLGPAIWESEA